MKWFNVLFILVVLQATNVFAATEILTFDSDELRNRYTELTFQFRCPKCQNQNVADSNAPISLDIRQKTYEMLHQGYSDQEIVDFMVDRYTEFVIYKPQMSIVTIWLWIVPAVLLISGLIILLTLTRRRVSAEEATLSEDEALRLKALMEDKS